MVLLAHFFLVMRTLLKLSKDEWYKFPLAAPILRKDMCMDYILSGYNFLNSALKLQNHVIEILNIGGMLLHKWRSNSPQLCQNKWKGIPLGDSEESKELCALWKS